MQKKYLGLIAVLSFLLIVIMSNTFVVSGNSVPSTNSYNLLRNYEKDYRNFEEKEIGDKVVYFQQRKIGGAVVELDYVLYHFDKESKKFVDKKVKLRDDLPDKLPKIIAKEQAETFAEGKVESSMLYFISPESDVFADIKTKNPVWVVRSKDKNGFLILTVIDAVTGEKLGYGTPPPSEAFSFTGPMFYGPNSPCSSGWMRWYQNAASWFSTLNYSTSSAKWPNKNTIKSYIQSTETALFYEIAHGGSYYFSGGCDPSGYGLEHTYPADIEAWIADYEKMPFTFLGSCDGLCDTSAGTFANKFTKGSVDSTVVAGYCGMAGTDCASCWDYSVYWQTAFFNYTSQGKTIGEAYNYANGLYPQCVKPSGNCMRVYGDLNLKLVPKVKRFPYIPGDTNKDRDVDLADLGTFAGYYGMTTGAVWSMGDFDGDGDVDLADLGLLAGNYNRTM